MVESGDLVLAEGQNQITAKRKKTFAEGKSLFSLFKSAV